MSISDKMVYLLWEAEEVEGMDGLCRKKEICLLCVLEWIHGWAQEHSCSACWLRTGGRTWLG